MKLSDFDYSLPEELIAGYPAAVRDRSKLLVMDRESGKTDHHTFYDIADLLKAGDVLVLNDSKVFPARLLGRKSSGGKAEILLTREVAPGRWEAIGKRLKVGDSVAFQDSTLIANVESRYSEILTVSFNLNGGSFKKEIERIGRIPLPPYIEKKREKSSKRYDDKESYQTVYAESSGSVAAPTAGLHFTTELLDKLKKKGVKILRLTLHVGPGTFLPVREENIKERSLHLETYSIKREVLREIRDARAGKHRIIAVGTTTTRVLEHLFATIEESDNLPPVIYGQTDIFIFPPYKFRAVDALITNFHLPKSSLILLVSAFAGRENIMKAYEEAIKHHYRFYSYGDAMLIVNTEDEKSAS